MRCAVFFDIDGTIISDDGKYIIPESTKRTIKKLRENGHMTFINTGRTIMNVDENIRSLGFDGYICGCGMYIVFRDEVIFERTLPLEECLWFREMSRRRDMAPLYERKDAFFIDKSCRVLPELQSLLDLYKTQKKDMSRTADEADFSFDKLVAWYDEKSDIEGFKADINEKYDYIDRGWGFCEIVPKGYSKGKGIRTVCEHFGIDIKNSYALGDSLNDLPMFLDAGVAIAMGNSHPGLIKYADFVTKDLHDDGVEYAMKHFGLI